MHIWIDNNSIYQHNAKSGATENKWYKYFIKRTVHISRNAQLWGFRDSSYVVRGKKWDQMDFVTVHCVSLIYRQT